MARLEEGAWEERFLKDKETLKDKSVTREEVNLLVFLD